MHCRIQHCFKLSSVPSGGEQEAVAVIRDMTGGGNDHEGSEVWDVGDVQDIEHEAVAGLQAFKQWQAVAARIQA